MSLIDMQHQYWVTKQTVLRKLGGKEDDCIVSSDAELDAKLELFRSISESCSALQRVIDQYQERLCVLAQEENSLGQFLKETSKSNESVGKHMSSTGKALCYMGQQRMQLRDPLVRLHHEVDTFKGRAVQDTRNTLGAMERARTEYRADLKWMKAVSAQLDPDTGRGLEKFRKAQNQTRQSKVRFDRLTLDCLEKVDLLAAARCNMFSHALISYQATILTFFTRCSQTLHSTLSCLNSQPKYEFCVLKELKETSQDDELEEKTDAKEKLADDDQLLFFQDDYTDEEKKSEKKADNENFSKQAEDLLSLTSDIIESVNDLSNGTINNIDYDLLGLVKEQQDYNQHKTDSMTDFFESLLQYESNNSHIENITGSQQNSQQSNMVTNDLNDDILSHILENPPKATANCEVTKQEQNKEQNSSMSSWLKLFSDLDPLANPDAIMGSPGNSHRT